MEIENIHTRAGWYASYEESEQGKALILCQAKKIQQLLGIVENILFEIELCEDPKEVSEKIVLESIKSTLTNIRDIEHSEGYFKWVG